MARGKNRRKGGKVKRPTMVKKSKLKDDFNPVEGVHVPPPMRPVLAALQEHYERRVRYAELKGLNQHHKLKAEIEELRVNQIVLQTLLKELKLITQEQFLDEHKRYFEEVVGVVRNGRMQGHLIIDMFNVGVPYQSNTLDELKNFKNPIILRGQP
jgi:hypothetical protein